MHRKISVLAIVSVTIFGVMSGSAVLSSYAAPAQQSSQSVKADLMARVNALRTSHGLNALTMNSLLTSAAQSQADWMAQTGEISHTHQDGSTPITRAAAAGYPNSKTVIENIYMGSIAGEDDAWNFWLNSPVHYAAMVKPIFVAVGIGLAYNRKYGQAFVMLFGAPMEPTPMPTATRKASVNGGTTANSATTSKAGTTPYEVLGGDTLIKIAYQHGMTGQALADLNGIDLNSMLSVGQILLVPKPTIAQTVSNKKATPTKTPRTYVVQHGENLYWIAAKFNVTIDVIIAANHIKDPALISEGQTLLIPW